MTFQPLTCSTCAGMAASGWIEEPHEAHAGWCDVCEQYGPQDEVHETATGYTICELCHEAEQASELFGSRLY